MNGVSHSSIRSALFGDMAPASDYNEQLMLKMVKEDLF